MRNIIKTKKKLYVFLISFLVFLFITFLFNIHLKRIHTSYDSFDNFQNELLQKELLLNRNLDSISTFLSVFNDSLPSGLSILLDKNYTDYFKFFIFYNDSIIFWSDNSVPISSLNPADSTFPKIYNSGNGYYRLVSRVRQPYKLFGLFLIKNDFKYQNNYLKNDFNDCFSIPSNVDLVFSEQGFNIFSSDNTFLFSLIFSSDSQLSKFQLFLLFLLYNLTFLFFIGFLYEAYILLFYKTKNTFLFVFFILDILIIRIVLFYFRVPELLFSSNLFSPFYYAFSGLIPSLGDLFINSVFVLLISFFIFHNVKFNIRYRNISVWKRFILVSFLFLIISFLFTSFVLIFKSIIIDSNVSLNLNNIFSLSFVSILSLLIIFNFILSVFLISSKLCFFSFKFIRSSKLYFFALILSVLISFIYYHFFQPSCCFILIFFIIFLLSSWYFLNRSYRVFSTTAVVFYIIFYSLFSTYLLHRFNDFKERENRKLIALNLSFEQHDSLLEFLFSEQEQKIYSDTIIPSLIDDYIYPDISSELHLKKYLLDNYFTGYWRKYDKQFTICTAEDILNIKPENISVNCIDFFNDLIQNSGQKTDNENLFFLNYSPGNNGYLALFKFFSDDNSDFPLVHIFIEFTPKFIPKDLGFPDLLLDNNISGIPDLSEYNYAMYNNGELYSRVGSSFYNINLSNYGTFNDQFQFFDFNDFNHLFYKIDNSRSLLISIHKKNILDVFAPFSYFFILLGIYSLVFLFVFFILNNRKTFQFNFRTRLQISMASVILVSFLTIGIFTLFYINNLNEKKNQNILSEKAHSILVEFQHKLSDISIIDSELKDYLGDLLIKFSNVFFSDINIYTLNGDLIATSRPQIFDEYLISKKINSTAFRGLAFDKKSLFIQNEKIGRQEYLSAYIPFINDQNKIVAYLNLPYFAKENEHKREISNFLVAYINIYVILIAISVFIALLISNYISRPLRLIMNKIGFVKLGKQNEKIIWNKKDEIGQLITEYNRMIDELAISVELLAKSERESAWREMARQVAHEIKNPLTPMKLNIQHLKKSWDDNAPDWDNRLSKFTKTMIDQIETLSSIATEFSDFAKMPKSKNVVLDVSELIKNSLDLFKNYKNIRLSFFNPSNLVFHVFADKEQLLRAFINLLNNSVQAIGENPDGEINININANNKSCIIEISDNGKGIPDYLTDKIFSPNFTTKSGGMGLGLAIVKSIILSSDGEITFHSEEGKGTTFRIILPLFE